MYFTFLHSDSQQGVAIIMSYILNKAITEFVFFLSHNPHWSISYNKTKLIISICYLIKRKFKKFSNGCMYMTYIVYVTLLKKRYEKYKN
jgi:hypothetical protein